MNRSPFYIALWLSLFLIVFPLPVNSQAENGWEWVNPLPTGSLLNAVTWGDNQFLAVGMLGTVVTSPDGEHWASQASDVSDNLYGVTSGESKFVAVGGGWPNGQIILTSENGVSWRSQHPAVSDLWAKLYDVAWNGDIFVAVGDGQGWPLVLTSPDGDNWTRQEIGYFANLYGITWDGNYFVAVGKRTGTGSGDFARVFVSPDGIDWSINVAPYEELRDISWSVELELFVAIGADGGNSAVLTSPDRLSWSIQPFDNVEFDGITWDGKRFVIMGSRGTILTSSDGTDWSPQSPDSEENLSDVVSDSTRLVAVGDVGTILTSTNAVDWIKRNQNINGVYPFNDVIWADGRFIAIGYTSTESFVISSENGSDWISTATIEDQILNGIAWNGALFVAVGTGGTILTSPDAEIWTPQNSNITSKLTDVTWGNTQFVAIGSSGTIVTSDNGIHWVSQVSGTTGALNRVIWGNNEFVSVGVLVRWPINHPIILTSVDGEVWEQHISLDVLTNGILYSVAWGNDQYMVLNDSAICLTSNWIDWSINDSLTLSTLQDVTWGGNKFVVVGGDSDENSSIILTRTEGEGWIKRDSISKHALRGVTWNGSQFVVVGDNGTILRKLEICEGDLEPDGDVDGSDLALFAADFGRTDCSNDCEGDFDDDNDVDGSDLAVFAADFGRTDCPTP